jgi:hypothetical protein
VEARMSDYDHFDDIINSREGIFAPGLGAVDDGLKRFDSIESDVTSQGLIIEMACRQCGRPKQLLVEWPEMVALKCMVSPSDAFRTVPALARFASPWRIARVPRGIYWVPEDTKCVHCGGVVQPLVGPDECGRYLAEMRQRGWLNPDDEKRVGTHCLRMASQR